MTTPDIGLRRVSPQSTVIVEMLSAKLSSSSLKEVLTHSSDDTVTVVGARRTETLNAPLASVCTVIALEYLPAISWVTETDAPCIPTPVILLTTVPLS